MANLVNAYIKIIYIGQTILVMKTLYILITMFTMLSYEKGLRFDDSIDDDTRGAIVDIIKKYWDCFVQDGAHRPILRYKFGIDTGGDKPMCYRKPSYGPHEPKIIMTQVGQLQNNNWIRKCGGPWGSMVVLVQKSHQEHITDINEFVWHMCVSYRRLNVVT